MSRRAWIISLTAGALFYLAAYGLACVWQAATRGELPVPHFRAEP